MEPTAASSAPHVIRPVAGAAQAELSQVLRDGRVLAGTILESSPDGTLLLALGRQRVPAETDLRFQPGDHFFARVEEGLDGIVLKLLGGASQAESPLLAALRGVIGEDRPIGQLLQELAGRLRAALPEAGSAKGALQGLLAQLQGEVVAAEADGEALAKALRGSALRYEAALLTATREGASTAAFAAIAAGLKGRLLNLLDRLGEGPLREAVLRTLAGLEAEQLLNAARKESGDPMIWSFPYPDGSGWTTARLALQEREEESGNSEGEGGSQRLVLGVSFSRLGPIRVDFVRAAGRTTIRILVSKQEIADRLQRDAPELARRLGDGRFEVALQTRVGTSDELALENQARDVRYLRDHHVMDVKG